jgi:tetratricopeptide (TPR) repeat protein
MSEDKNYQELCEQLMAVAQKDGLDAAKNFINNYINENQDSYMGYLTRSEMNRGLAEYEEALKDAEKAITLNPNDVVSYNQRGKVYISLEKYDLALNDLNKSIEINKNNAEAFTNRAYIYLKRGEYKKVIEDSTKAIDLQQEPDFAPYLNRGLAKMNMGKKDEAIDDFSKVIDIADNATAYCKRGYLCGEKAIDDKNEDLLIKAIRDLDKAIEMDDQDAEAYFVRGHLMGERLLYEDAIEDLEKFLELDPNSVNANLAKKTLKKLQSMLKKEEPEYDYVIEQKIILYGAIIGGIIGAILGISGSWEGIFIGLWFGIGFGGSMDTFRSCWRVFLHTKEKDGFIEAIKTSFIGGIFLLILWTVLGPVGHLNRYIIRIFKIRKLRQ